MDALFGLATVALLMRRWRWLAAGAVIAAAIAGVLVLSQPRTYTATVDVVPKRARTEVNYDTPIRTLSSDTGGQASGGQASSPLLAPISPERRMALAELVRNPDVEQAVREELGSKLPESMRAPGRLMRLVEGKLIPRSEVIAITVGAPDPALAEQIASSWSRAYERKVNQLYGTSPSTATNLNREVSNAQQKYRTAEDALTSFTVATSLGEDSRLLEAKQQTASDLYRVA